MVGYTEEVENSVDLEQQLVELFSDMPCDLSEEELVDDLPSEDPAVVAPVPVS